MIVFRRLDKNDLLKKKESYLTDKSDIYIAENYCHQTGILLSNSQSLKDEVHLRENNDRVSYIILILLKIYKTYKLFLYLLKQHVFFM